MILQFQSFPTRTIYPALLIMPDGAALRDSDFWNAMPIKRFFDRLLALREPQLFQLRPARFSSVDKRDALALLIVIALPPSLQAGSSETGRLRVRSREASVGELLSGVSQIFGWAWVVRQAARMLQTSARLAPWA